MQVPIASIMEIATGAAGLVQKILKNGSGGGDFEGLLKSALGGSSKLDGSFIKQFLSKQSGDAGNLDELFASAAGVTLFQFMAELKKLGLNVSELQALLGGDLKSLPAETMQKLLASLGMSEDEITQIMADPELLDEIKVSLSDTLQGLLKQHADERGIDVSELVDSLGDELDGIDDLALQLENILTATGGKKAEISDAVRQELQALVNDVVKGTDANNHVAALLGAMRGNVSKSENAIKVDSLTETLKGELGLEEESIKSLIYSSDAVKRQQAVADVTARLTEFAKKNQGKPLTPELKEALGFLKGVMSESEFAGLQNSLKLFANLNLASIKPEFSTEFANALNERFNSDGPDSVIEKHLRQIMDQLKRGVSDNVRNGQGDVSLKLNPPMLGRVDVNVNMVDGLVNATFKSDQAMTRDMLQQNMVMLKDALAEQGVKVNNVQVTSGFNERPQDESAAYAMAEQQSRQNRQNRGNSPQQRMIYQPGTDPEPYIQAMPPLSLDGRLDLFA